MSKNKKKISAAEWAFWIVYFSAASVAVCLVTIPSYILQEHAKDFCGSIGMGYQAISQVEFSITDTDYVICKDLRTHQRFFFDMTAARARGWSG